MTVVPASADGEMIEPIIPVDPPVNIGFVARVIRDVGSLYSELMEWVDAEADFIYDAFMEDIRADYCSSSPNKRHNFVSQYTQDGYDYGRYYACEYCRELVSDLYFEKEQEYIDSLTTPEISGVFESLSFRLPDDALSAIDGYYVNNLLIDYDYTPNSIDFVIGSYGSGGSSGNYAVEPYYSRQLENWYSDSFYVGTDGNYSFSFGGADVQSIFPAASSWYRNINVFVQKYVDGYWQNISGWSLGFEELKDGIYYHHIISPFDYSINLVGGYNYRFYVQLQFTTDVRGYTSSYPSYYTGYEGYLHLQDINVSLGEDAFVPSSNTRPVSLMQTINNYNNDNSYTDNSTTNYFIGIVDDNGEVTDVYNPTVYDETTKIFTEPVTGAQYQTSGWTYNYLSRTYDIALADNTFLIGATPVSRIELTYGDEAVTLVYYDANNNILGHDDYAYVAVAKDECTLYGHSYTYEIIKDATCTEMGERKYTCSRCGNEYAEDIPKDEHTLTVKEHINTKYDSDGNVLEVGYTLYECDVCGEQKRENDDASEVDDSWLNWLGTQFRKLGSGLVGGLADGIEYLTGTVIKSVTDWSLGLVEWLFGLVDGNLLNTWYSWFNEDNPYINQELEKDGTEVDSIWA